MEKVYHLITFATTSAAMAMLKVMEDGGAAVHMMPIPGCISAGCGLSLRFAPELDPQIRGLAAGSGLPPDSYRFYRLDSTGGKQTAEPL